MVVPEEKGSMIISFSIFSAAYEKNRTLKGRFYDSILRSVLIVNNYSFKNSPYTWRLERVCFPSCQKLEK